MTVRGATLRALTLLAALGGGLLVASCGIGPGLTGNDTGGIIQWTPANEAHAGEIAAAYCARYNKYAHITSDHPRYGDFVDFACTWRPVATSGHARFVHRSRNVVRARD